MCFCHPFFPAPFRHRQKISPLFLTVFLSHKQTPLPVAPSHNLQGYLTSSPGAYSRDNRAGTPIGSNCLSAHYHTSPAFYTVGRREIRQRKADRVMLSEYQEEGKIITMA